MRQSTLHHIRERIAHANQTHGKFFTICHIIEAAAVELHEARLAADYGTEQSTVRELLDVATVCIRGAEQLGGLEGTEYDPAEVAIQPRTVTAEQIEKAIWHMHPCECESCKVQWRERAVAAFAAAGFNVEEQDNA
jgi:hypothetical protein